MKRVIVFVLLSLSINAHARGDGSVAGRVSESETGKLLAGANIIITLLSRGTSSGPDGNYRIDNVPQGTYMVRFSLIGYATRTIDLTVGNAETTTVDVVMAPALLPGSPITVTSTRGRERETPSAFATLTQQQIRDRYTTQDIPVLLSELPSSTSYSESGNDIGYTYLNIRGFDARRIAVMVNGIPQNDPEDHNVYWLDFPDLAGMLEDVQVQRGAGSAFYGPPAIGGSVNLVTNEFAGERSVYASAGFGSFNTRRYAAGFSSGLIENRYAFSARLGKILSDGYRDRSWTDFNSYFFGAVRYDESMTTEIHLYGGPVSDHLAYYGIPKADVGDREKRRANPIARPEELENFSQPHYELFHEWRVGPSVTLNNTFFLVTGEGFFDYDGSWAPLSYYRITAQNGFPVTGDPDNQYLPGALIRAFVSNRQYGWLPRVTVRHGAGEFIAGGEVRIHRSEHWGRLEWADAIPFDVPNDYHYYEYRGAKDILSVYAHELYHLRPDLSLMANIQYAYNRYRLYGEKYIGTDFSVPYHFINPRAGINYNIDGTWNVYGSVAYTTREPRLKNLYDAAEASTPAAWGAVLPQFTVTTAGRYSFNDPLVTPESLVDIEVGAGYAGENVKIGANVYWMDFSDEIVKSGQVDRFGQPVTGNADRTRHIGIELSAHATPVQGVELSGTMSISRNRFIRFADYSTGSAVPLNGNTIAGFPDMLANVRFTYTNGPLTFSWATRYVGKQYTDNYSNEANTVDPVFVSSASLICAIGGVLPDVRIEAKLQVNNLFDALYAAYGEGDQFFVGAERNAFCNLSITF